MNIIDKVNMNVDFQENVVMPLLHGALPMFSVYNVHIQRLILINE